jgi:hypothetical protein
MSLLIRFLNRFQPREGWALFLLTLVVLLCPAAALIEANDDLDAVALLVLTVLAAIFGLRLARSRLSARGAIPLAGLLGGFLVTIVVGRLLPPLSLLWAEISYAADWLASWQHGVINYPLPFASATGFLWQQLNALGMRLWWWGQTVTSDTPIQDPIAFLLLACCLAWAFGCFATWQIYRRRSALAGLLPSGTAMAATAFFSGGLTLFYLLVFLFCTLWLIATCHLCTRRDYWQRTNTDYPGDLGVELLFALSPPLTLILVLAAFFPVIHPAQVRDAFWELMDGPWSTIERTSERLFGPIRHRGPAGDGWGGSLPRAHLLGGGPELGTRIVMYVSTNDPPPLADLAEPEAAAPGPPRRYWRSMTYDTYNGLGWLNGPLETRTSSPNQPLDPSLPAGFELLQQFDMLVSGEGQLHAVNAPFRADHEVQSWWRGPDDLAEISSHAERYTIFSRPPGPTTADLRHALPVTPPSLADRYLALPRTIPQRVLDLAQEVVGGAETRYDQALAIETYLRAYTYTLDLPAPPTDRDLVDYFLFEQQAGYCDYYASAMVVMARAVGIPARLATGYAQGTYDHDAQRWVVTEADGHSWVEIYFDGIGWVEFEPTAGRPALDRVGGGELPRPSVPALPPRSVRWWQRIPWALVGMGSVLILAAVVVMRIWHPRRRRDLAATDLVLDRYGRLLDWGRRLNQPLRDGQTPSEYSASLSERLRTQGRESRWSRVRQASIEAPPVVDHLTETFVQARYSSEPISEREGWHIRDLWIRLRRRLWWLWLDHR